MHWSSRRNPGALIYSITFLSVHTHTKTTTLSLNNSHLTKHHTKQRLFCRVQVKSRVLDAVMTYSPFHTDLLLLNIKMLLSSSTSTISMTQCSVSRSPSRPVLFGGQGGSSLRTGQECCSSHCSLWARDSLHHHWYFI